MAMINPMFGSISYNLTDFNQLSSVETPVFQRALDETRVVELIQYVKTKLDENKPPVLGVISLAKISGKLYILDGQHRLEAFRRIPDYRSIAIMTIVYEVKNIIEAQQIFRDINLSVPVSEVFLVNPSTINLAQNELQSQKRRILQEACLKFNTKYKFFSDTPGNRPRVTLGLFMEKIEHSGWWECFNDQISANVLLGYFNEIAKTTAWDGDRNNIRSKYSSLTRGSFNLDLIKKNNFYLGCFKDVDNMPFFQPHKINQYIDGLNNYIQYVDDLINL
jgi:hypothetical protein